MVGGPIHAAHGKTVRREPSGWWKCFLLGRDVGYVAVAFVRIIKLYAIRTFHCEFGLKTWEECECSRPQRSGGRPRAIGCWVYQHTLAGGVWLERFPLQTRWPSGLDAQSSWGQVEGFRGGVLSCVCRWQKWVERVGQHFLLECGCLVLVALHPHPGTPTSAPWRNYSGWLHEAASQEVDRPQHCMRSPDEPEVSGHCLGSPTTFWSQGGREDLCCLLQESGC